MIVMICSGVEVYDASLTGILYDFVWSYFHM